MGRKAFFKVCSCEREFNVRSTYYKHKKTCLGNKLVENLNIFKSYVGNFVCKEKDCLFKSIFSSEFIAHLQAIHKIEVSHEIKDFQQYSDFKTWKEQFEKETRAYFSLRTRRKTKTTNEKSEYYYCNRSGFYNSVLTSRKRRLKAQGIKRIGFNCPASIKVCIKEPENIRATICSYHYGHDTELSHLPIPKSDRDALAEQLSQGIPHDHILTNIIDDNVKTVERKHLCTKRDLLNISNSYGIIINNIKKRKRRKKVDMHIENSQEENSILLDKKQDDETNIKRQQQCKRRKKVDMYIENSQEENSILLDKRQDDETNIKTLKIKLLERHKALIERIKNCNDREILLAAKDHLNDAYHTFDILQTSFNTK